MAQEKETLTKEFEIVKVEKYSGEFTTNEGATYPYKFYKVYFKEIGGQLIMTAKVDKVFNDYVEWDNED